MKKENLNITRLLCYMVEEEDCYEDILHFAVWQLVLKNLNQLNYKELRDKCLADLEKELLQFSVCQDKR